ncbi:hypothetical protein BH10ACT11_BH10ACT11_08790 [soil metagenome]
MSTVSGHTEAQQAAIWHDVECGSYEADLSLWRSLAADNPGRVLELGTGTGRVALDLARRGTSVVALDFDQQLIDALGERAAGLPLEAVAGDMIDFDLSERFSLVLAPMQVMQLLAAADRPACFERVRAHLEPGGAFAVAIVEGAPPAAQAPEHGPIGTLPDIVDREGWVYSSLPLGVAIDGETMVVQRLRQIVSPDGELTESESTDRLALLDAETIESEARACGLLPAKRYEVAATDAHIASMVLLLEATR